MKKKRSGFVCFLLILVMIAEAYVAAYISPGFIKYKKENAGASEEMEIPAEVEALLNEVYQGVTAVEQCGIRFPESNSVPAETLTVAGSSPETRFENGVTVTLDPYSVCDEAEHSLSVASLGIQSNDDYEAVAYDVKLDGGSAELAGIAKLELPYDPAWGDNVLVQYFNESTGSWEILYTEVDERGKAVCYTDHFCTFAVFCSMVLKGEGLSDGNLLIPVGEAGPDQSVAVNYGALASYIRGISQMPGLSNIPVPAMTVSDMGKYTEYGLGVLGDFTGGIDTATQAGMAGGSGLGMLSLGQLEKMKGLSDKLGSFGAALACAKLVSESIRTGDVAQTLKNNLNDVASVGLWAAAAYYGGSVATMCNIAGIVLFVLSMAGKALNEINVDGLEAPEFAYRKFSNKYIVYNRKGGLSRGVYYKDKVEYAWENPDEILQQSEYYLRCSSVTQYSDWKMYFDEVAKYDYSMITKKIDHTLLSYVNVFWNLPRTNPNALNRFLSDTRYGNYLWGDMLNEVYKRPSDHEIGVMREKYRADILSWVRPYMDELVKIYYYKVLNDVYRKVTSACDELNKELSFSLNDPDTDSFAESEYADCRLYLSDATGNCKLFFTPEQNYQFSCTNYYYGLNGSPATFYAVRDMKKVLELPIVVHEGMNVITVAKPEEETDSAAGDLAALEGCWYRQADADDTANAEYSIQIYVDPSDQKLNLTVTNYTRDGDGVPMKLVYAKNKYTVRDHALVLEKTGDSMYDFPEITLTMSDKDFVTYHVAGDNPGTLNGKTFIRFRYDELKEVESHYKMLDGYGMKVE